MVLLLLLGALVRSQDIWTPSLDDWARAARKPASAYRGSSFLDMNAVLNRHLARMTENTVECAELSLEKVFDTHRMVFAARSRGFDEFYQQKSDPRSLPLRSSLQLEQAIDHGYATVEFRPDMTAYVRDTHCRLAVMTFVHHVSERARQELLSMISLPTLPSVDHSQFSHLGHQENESSVKHSVKLYGQANACADCHFNTDTKPRPAVNATTTCVKGLQAASCYYYAGDENKCETCSAKAVTAGQAICTEQELKSYCGTPPTTRPMHDNVNYTIYAGTSGCCEPSNRWTQVRNIDRRYDLKQQLEINAFCNSTDEGFADGSCCMLDSCKGKPSAASVQYQDCHLFYNGTTIWEYYPSLKKCAKVVEGAGMESDNWWADSGNDRYVSTDAFGDAPDVTKQRTCYKFCGKFGPNGTSIPVPACKEQPCCYWMHADGTPCRHHFPAGIDEYSDFVETPELLGKPIMEELPDYCPPLDSKPEFDCCDKMGAQDLVCTQCWIRGDCYKNREQV